MECISSISGDLNGVCIDTSPHLMDNASSIDVFQFHHSIGRIIWGDGKVLIWIGILVTGLYILWILFVRPFNLFRDYSDLGFEQITQHGMFKSNASKRNAVNEYRKRRKVGDLPPAYPNGWFAILESDQLPVKTATEVDALGLNLVAWRGENGRCYVADAYCPHLGAHLGVGGTVKGDCIQCPFHTWSFEGCTGKLVNIPYADSVPEVATLKMYKVIELHGFIYLWYHADNEEPTWSPDYIPEVESKSWKYRGRSEFRISCHIQEIPENGPDVAHLNVLHASPILTGTDPTKSIFQWEFLKHVWSAKWQPLDGLRKHEAVLSVEHHCSLFNKFPFFHIDVDCHQVGPGIVLMHFNTIFGKGTLIQTVTPLEPLLQKVTHRFYSTPTFIHPFGLLILHGEAVQISRDIRIWNRKTFIRRPILIKEDKQIKLFRRWYSQFYSEGSVPCYIGSNSKGQVAKLDF